MARPTKSDDEKLGPTWSFRLTQADYDACQKKVKASGLSKSEFFRLHVLNNTTQVVAASSAPPDSVRAMHYLRKASNNINQLAKLANRENRANQLSESTFLGIANQLTRFNAFLLDQVKAIK